MAEKELKMSKKGILIALALAVVTVGVVAVVASSSSSSSTARLPAPRDDPSRFIRVRTTRRWGKDDFTFDDDGVNRDAIRYYSAQWQPAPWGVLAWTDHARRAEVFTFVPHPDLNDVDWSVNVYWNPEKDDSVSPWEFRDDSATKSVRRDEQYDNRFVHRHQERAGVFLIVVHCFDEEICIYHRPEALPALAAPVSAENLNAHFVRNPFMETVERFSTLHGQYQEAKKAVEERKLAIPIEQAVMDELDRLYQKIITSFDEEDTLLTPL